MLVLIQISTTFQLLYLLSSNNVLHVIQVPGKVSAFCWNYWISWSSDCPYWHPTPFQPTAPKCFTTDMWPWGSAPL